MGVLLQTIGAVLYSNRCWQNGVPPPWVFFCKQLALFYIRTDAGKMGSPPYGCSFANNWRCFIFEPMLAKWGPPPMGVLLQTIGAVLYSNRCWQNGVPRPWVFFCKQLALFYIRTDVGKMGSPAHGCSFANNWRCFIFEPMLAKWGPPPMGVL